MARAVLAGSKGMWSVRAIALLCSIYPGILAAGHVFASESPKALVCTGDSAAESSELRDKLPSFRQRTETGPLYKAIVSRAGPPRSCEQEIKSGVLSLAYTFTKEATLVSRIDPRIEFSEEHLVVRGLSSAEARALLKKGELHAFGNQGCGIDWRNAEIEKSKSSPDGREEIYRGDACNCQGRIIYEGKRVSAIILRSAC